MSGMKIYKGEFDKQLELLLAPQIKAGFPSPAQDYMRESLDFNRDFIRHPEATFYGRVDGDSMEDAGIDDGDIAVIDRSLEAQDGDIVVGYVNGEFTIKFLDLKHKADGYIELRPANKKYDPIRVEEYDEFEVWGVVVWTPGPERQARCCVEQQRRLCRSPQQRSQEDGHQSRHPILPACPTISQREDSRVLQQL